MGIQTHSRTDSEYVLAPSVDNNRLQYASATQAADSRDLLGLWLEQNGWGKLARRGRDNASAQGGALEKKEMDMDSISLPMSCLERTCWLAMGACLTMLPFWYWNTSFFYAGCSQVRCAWRTRLRGTWFSFQRLPWPAGLPA